MSPLTCPSSRWTDGMGCARISWTLHPVPHLPLKPLPHLFAPRRIRVRGRARGIDEALACMQHIRTDVLRERSRMPSDLRDRMSLRRIFETRTEAPRAHHGYAAPARTAPSRVPASNEFRAVTRRRRTEARAAGPSSPRRIVGSRRAAASRPFALLCSAYSRTGSGVPVPAPQRTAASLVGSGICGEVVGGVVQCEPSGPEADHGRGLGHYITR
ncbi:hypothetical protein EDB92DRAFT_389753 [Lactarius akahatsu]|uniref:Uncharacterized protein n=1 Tax=Lactarius akahatsu TaxID=416441 RepID=A0AAD4Q7Y7_9AGAM|nr:hypothetical protein EDB92DRAFT_389753 [Lactarius akahatsu]